MSGTTVPKWLHDVFGERPRAGEVVTVLAFGVTSATCLMWAMPAAEEPPLWRWALAWLLTADIAAGSLANFTASTNDFYAARPVNRRVFLAVHGHVLAVAWAVGAPLGPAVAVWLYALAAGSVVNALAGRDSQRFVAALFLAVALAALPLFDVPGPLLAVYALFVLKVVYAFAVDHSRPSRSTA